MTPADTLPNIWRNVSFLVTLYGTRSAVRTQAMVEGTAAQKRIFFVQNCSRKEPIQSMAPCGFAIRAEQALRPRNWANRAKKREVA
jgi:hypothetical protein